MATVTQVEVNSALGVAHVRITRPYTGQRGNVVDLPEDMREALWRWIVVSRPDYCDLCCSAPCKSIVACASAR